MAFPGYVTVTTRNVLPSSSSWWLIKASVCSPFRKRWLPYAVLAAKPTLISRYVTAASLTANGPCEVYSSETRNLRFMPMAVLMTANSTPSKNVTTDTYGSH